VITHGGRLPEQTARFFGRSQEAAAIKGALASSRLVTLTGPGGVGKTRLAVKVAGEVAQAFPDGVFLADLSAVRDAAGIARALTSALGTPRKESQQDLPPPDWLVSRLRGKRLLLILDTCEHVIGACAALADAILRGGREPELMVTSRQPLDLPGEVVFRIPPLSIGADGGDGGDAVSLFADRAAAAAPGFEVTADTLPRLVRLCRLLDGIPLEIELAALRLRAVGIDELLARLPGHLRLLGSGHRRSGNWGATDDRQQSLQASIGWSYDLCSPRERLLWGRLSVFRGCFDLAAVEEVCSGGELGVDEILDTLVGLVDKSVVLRAADTGGTARYRLPGVAREHGAEHADDADSCAVRYRAYADKTAVPGTASLPRPRSGLAGPASAASQPPARQVPASLGPGFADPPAGARASPWTAGLGTTGPEAADTVPTGRWELLTAREREVAGLVARGLTNKDIASRLVVSKRTVDAHLEHILGKLGYSSRRQVAALAAQEREREHEAPPARSIDRR
jgi:predicted ATPase/DNA-binding CsgD family transcriptional regulator